MSITFGNSTWLWALLILLPLIGLFYYAQKHRNALVSKIIAPRLHAELIKRVSMPKRIARSSCILLALGFLMIALARPRYGYEEHQEPTHGRDVIIAIDTSRSMLATDVAPTRLGRAKLLAQDVLELLPGDRVGLIAFAGRAFLQAPMTLDHSAVREAITELDTNLIPKGGTNIAEAIHLAITAFGKGEGTDRALILITDGEDLEADGITAAKEAGALGIKIFTIGIGSAEGSLIPVTTEEGKNDFVRDERGKPVLSKLDITRLKEIAAAANGFYEPFGNDAAHTIIQKGILPIAASNAQSITARRPIERYEWPLCAALFFLIAWLLLNERRRYLTLVALSFIFFPKSLQATPGISDYQKGNYQQALTIFENRLKAGHAVDEVGFDAGAAAYQQGDYKKAISYFTGAMTSSSPKIQQAATYNLANALVRSGEAATESTEKLSDWKSAIQHYDTVLKKDPKNKEAQENREIVKKLIEDFKKRQDQQKQKQDQKDQKQNPQDNNNSQQNNSLQDQQKKDQKQDQQQSSSSQGSSKDQANNSSKQDQQNPQTDKNNQQKESSPQNNPTPTPSPSGNGSGNNTSSTPTPPSKENASPTPQPTPTPKQTGEEKTPTPSAKNEEQESQSNTPNPSQNSNTSNNSNNQSGKSNLPSTPTQPTPTEKKEGSLSGGEQGEATPVTSTEEEKEGIMSRGQAEAILRSTEDEEQQVQFQRRQDAEETIKDW